MDKTSILGIIIGLSAIVVGNIIEGGSVGHLVQFAAAFIVFGGTLGATLLSYPAKDVLDAIKSLRFVLLTNKQNPQRLIDEIIALLNKARKFGLLHLEEDIDKISHPFFKTGIRLIVDGMPAHMMRETLYQKITAFEEQQKKSAKIFESAGGFAPTIGIIGAVLGLIQVMRDISDPTRIGVGIAIAFVATIYGVGIANIILIPISKKILIKMQEEILIMELIVEGITGIESGINPYYLKEKLSSYID